MTSLTDTKKKMGVLSKVNYSDWASPTVYIKKKSKEIATFLHTNNSRTLNENTDQGARNLTRVYLR